ncbi:hypothetical protein CCACVL1_03760 [Corchorus capsularis]|uniref:Uncharacterized protein n=1 Tax=Corchorus capsularis TaxID=210143 RepID=A0A1R3JXI9_COCAP|nr:hypothetical protein CCACVL1_03760 [Corchorus capsularis]
MMNISRTPTPNPTGHRPLKLRHPPATSTTVGHYRQSPESRRNFF